MAVAERGAEVSFAPILAGLERFYGEMPLSPPPEGAGGGREIDLLRRLANDLRAGAFEGQWARDRAARDLLWRLTIARLRESNPRFLAANGVS
jgi:hypothetical protein